MVRHGQASFGAKDYDRLSDLGHLQSERLGAYFREQGIGFEAVLTGTLRRQVETADGIARGMRCDLHPTQWPELNEYDSTALMAAMGAATATPAGTIEGRRSYFRRLRGALHLWAAGELNPQGMPMHAAFVQGVSAVLDHVRQQHQGPVLLVSSGGPIAMAVGQVLDTSAETAIELNLRIRNTGVTELAFNPKRHSLVAFNQLPHLASRELASWITDA